MEVPTRSLWTFPRKNVYHFIRGTVFEAGGSIRADNNQKRFEIEPAHEEEPMVRGCEGVYENVSSFRSILR